MDLGVRRLDTAYNYLRFASHRALAEVAGDLLGEFEISTKVGFFPDGHSLDPLRLRKAIEQSATELGRPPNLVFLHNPERSLNGLPKPHGRDALAAAVTTLTDTVRTGLSNAWGISSWNAEVLMPYLAEVPAPDVLMTRCGLTCAPAALDAAGHLAELLNVPAAGRWGMAPFGGTPAAVPWPAPGAFVRGQVATTPLQAAFAVAYHLPDLAAIAVGADQRDHLAELIAATRLDIDPARVAAYRALLTQRKATVTS
ncbi:aldo/keto reductase [Spirillospora sp. NPDC052269]